MKYFEKGTACRDNPILEIENLEVIYETDTETVHAVNGVSLSLREGESIGLVGETGAGKTTTALAVLKLLPDRTGHVTNGSIRFQGRDLLDVSEKEMQLIRGDAADSRRLHFHDFSGSHEFFEPGFADRRTDFGNHQAA